MVIEWLVDFICGIIIDNLFCKEVSNFYLMVFIFFMFVFVLNILGFVIKIVVGDDFSVWKSLIVDLIVILMLVMMMIVLIYFFGMKCFGFKGYLVNSYLRFVGFLLLVKLMEEFMNLLILGLCLYGNIFVGEVLLGLIVGIVVSVGLWVILLVILLEMIWVVFLIFIGCI